MTQRPDPSARLFGMMFMTVGFLIVATCGTCTVVVGFSALADAVTYPGTRASAPMMLLLALVVGGLPTLLGLLLMRAGYRRVSGGRGE